LDFVKTLCQLAGRDWLGAAEEFAMKIRVEVECTPEEARDFLGLPDLSKANSVYVDVISKAMKGASSVEQVQDFAKNIAPMGQVGLKLFQQFVESGSAFAAGAAKKKKDD
jgi:hypothetical protein